MVTFYIYKLDEPNKVGITSEEKEDLKLLQQLNFPDTKFANAYFKCAFGESTENNGMKVFKLEIPIKLEIMDNYHLWAGLIDNVREICAHYHKYRDKLKSLYRQKAAYTKQSHEEYANELIRDSVYFIVETMNFKGLAKRSQKTERAEENDSSGC